MSPRGRPPFQPTASQRQALRRVELSMARARKARDAGTEAIETALAEGVPAHVVADAAGLGLNTVRRIGHSTR